MPLKTGQQAPDFKLKSTSGSVFHLSEDMKGQACILYFYPRDFTPGCTEEACSFRDAFAEFRNLDIPVFGISRDSISIHKKFKKQYKLPFDLLSDKTGKVCKSYDALVPIIRVPKRITYLLDADHNIAAVYSDMFGAQNHVRQMIKKLNNPNK